MSFVTLSDCKYYLSIKSATTTYDDLLNFLITKASKYIETYVGRNIEATDYIQLYSGDGENDLILDNYPVNSVSVLSVGVDFDDKKYTTPLDATSFLIQKDPGILIQHSSVFPIGRYNIYCSYNAGYTSVPEDLKMICLDLIAKKYNDIEKGRFGISVKNIMNENINFIIYDLSKENQTILKKYRKPPRTEGIDVTGYTEE